jgi:lipopolysaccharide transport system ATP-binding protein
MSAPKVEIKHLSKIFYQSMSDMVVKRNTSDAPVSKNDKLVLNDINLVLNSGETVGIIGRNGAGKSTLLSIIVGIASQTQGEVTVTGKVTAVMTLGVGLREDLTGRENIYLDGEIQGKSRTEIDQLIDKIIDFAELDEFIDKPVKIYSTGMKSRLAFSMLVEIEPEILIIDEALSAGDIFFAEKASKKIREICQKGKIVILVSHSMGTIDTMCTRCLWLENGNITMDDKPAIVTQAYLKKIREEDDLSDTKKMQKEASETIEDAHYKINSAVLKQIDSDYLQNVFYTQDSFVLELELNRITTHVPDLNLIINVERIDGLLIHNQKYNLSEIKNDKTNRSWSFKLELPSLVINKGYYQIKVELKEHELITNYFTRHFEIRNNQMPSGGAPLLHYPAEITLVNEEKSECLDSIELTAE